MLIFFYFLENRRLQKKKELKEIIEENLETANSTCTCFDEKTKLR